MTKWSIPKLNAIGSTNYFNQTKLNFKRIRSAFFLVS